MTRCLAAVFADPPKFEIEFVKRRGKTEARLWFVRDGYRVEPRYDSGGARDVASLGLRLAKLLMERPARRRLLVLDEPFRNVSKENRPKLVNLVRSLAKELKVQFVIVTHEEEYKAMGRVINLEISGKSSRMKRGE